MARQALRFTLDDPAAPGVYDTDAIAGNITLLRMTTPVTDQPTPLMWVVRDAAGSNRRVQTGSEQYAARLRVSTMMFYGQAKLFLPAFCTPLGGLPGLKTFTIDQFISLDVSAFTKKYTRWLGCTPETLTLRASNSGQGVLLSCDMTFVARGWNHTITATDFPDPAISAYDYSQPAVFQHAAGLCSVNGLTANFKSFELSLKNTLDDVYDERPNPTPQYYGARDVDWTMDYRLVSDIFRSTYESVTPYSASIAFTDGTTTVTFNFQDANYTSGLDRQLPLDKAFYESVKGQAYLDTVTGTDLTLTVAP
jgi:hypothetical protein